MELPWQLSGVPVPRGHFRFLSLYLSTFQVWETFQSLLMELQKRCDQVALSLCWSPLWPDEEEIHIPVPPLAMQNRKQTVTSEQPNAGVNSLWKRKKLLCLRNFPLFWTGDRSWTPGNLDFFKQSPLEMEYISSHLCRSTAEMYKQNTWRYFFFSFSLFFFFLQNEHNYEAEIPVYKFPEDFGGSVVTRFSLLLLPFFPVKIDVIVEYLVIADEIWELGVMLGLCQKEQCWWHFPCQFCSRFCLL